MINMKVQVLLTGNALRTSIGSLGASSVTFIKTDNLNILIDTTHYGRRKLLIHALHSAGLHENEVDTVILTHLHWDHALNYDLFLHSEFYIGSEEIEYNRKLLTEDIYAIRNMNKLLEGYNINEVEKDIMKISNEVEIIKTPGHTPGHLVVVAKDADEKYVITGDMVPNARSWFRGRPDIITFNETEAIKNVEKIKQIGKNSIIIPGHDSPFKIVDGKVENWKTEDIEIILREDREKDLTIKLNETNSRPNYH